MNAGLFINTGNHPELVRRMRADHAILARSVEGPGATSDTRRHCCATCPRPASATGFGGWRDRGGAPDRPAAHIPCGWSAMQTADNAPLAEVAGLGSARCWDFSKGAYAPLSGLWAPAHHPHRIKYASHLTTGFSGSWEPAWLRGAPARPNRLLCGWPMRAHPVRYGKRAQKPAG